MTNPETKMAKQSHQTGLKEKIVEYANNAPMTPPEPAECVLIFHFILIRMQEHWIRAETAIIFIMKGGRRRAIISCMHAM